MATEQNSTHTPGDRSEVEKLLKVIKRIALRSSLHIRAKDLGSKDSRHLVTIHAMATEAIAAARVSA